MRPDPLGLWPTLIDGTLSAGKGADQTNDPNGSANNYEYQPEEPNRGPEGERFASKDPIEGECAARGHHENESAEGNRCREHPKDCSLHHAVGVRMLGPTR